MIAQVNTPQRQKRFRNACRGRLVYDATLPLGLRLLGKSQPGRYYSGPTLALELSGQTAWLAGHANPDELASFLSFCGCTRAVLDEAECPLPTGWQRETTLSIFGLEPFAQLPLPVQTAQQQALWQSMELVCEPKAGPLTQMLFADRPERWDDFYAELCIKRSRGAARVWALEQNGTICCTVGAYALGNGQAYMACGETAEALRGQKLGGRLIVWVANTLAAEGWRPLFLCSPERVHFYTGLGFRLLGTLTRCQCPPTEQE